MFLAPISFDEIKNNNDIDSYNKLFDRFNNLVKFRKDLYFNYNLQCRTYNDFCDLGSVKKSSKFVCSMYCIHCRRKIFKTCYAQHLRSKKHITNTKILDPIESNKFLITIIQELLDENNNLINDLNNFVF